MNFMIELRKFSYNILKINESKVIILTGMDMNSG
nr:MAG TPA: hypothetical protein [Caudoviricetes sp.]